MDRPLVLEGLSPRARRRSARSRARGRGSSSSALDRRLASPAGRLLAGAASVLAALLARRRLRLALIAAALLAVLLPGGWLLLRSTAITAVRQVRIVGVSGPEAAAIDSALTEAARRMSTLGVSDGALLAAVQRFRIVQAVRAEPSFPHGLRIVVTERQPVAVLTSGSERTAVAGDGTVLGPALASSSLPAIAAPGGDILAARVTQPSMLGALRLLAAAPGPLAARVTSVSEGSKGLTVTMHNGLTVYFGDASLPHAKWLALARVLADQASHGASYIDVRSPSRPAAGGFAPGTGPAATAANGAAEQHGTAAQPTVSGLAESLAAAVGGPAGAAAPSTTPQEQAEQKSGGTGEGAGSGKGAGVPEGGSAGSGTAGAPQGGSAQGGAPQGGSEAATRATGGSEAAPAEGG